MSRTAKSDSKLPNPSPPLNPEWSKTCPGAELQLSEISGTKLHRTNTPGGKLQLPPSGQSQQLTFDQSTVILSSPGRCAESIHRFGSSPSRHTGSDLTRLHHPPEVLATLDNLHLSSSFIFSRSKTSLQTDLEKKIQRLPALCFSSPCVHLGGPFSAPSAPLNSYRRELRIGVIKSWIRPTLFPGKIRQCIHFRSPEL